MGKASAIPEHLFRYSDQNTRAAQDLQDWVRGVLVPALHEYLAGAAHQSSGVNVAIGGVSGRQEVITSDLPQQIAKAYYTDRHVRTVGRLFQIAGESQSPLAPFGPPLNPDADARALVRTSDETLDQLDRDAGAAFARRMPEGPPSDGMVAAYWQSLGQWADDPIFAAGFYNALTPQQLQSLPWNDSTTSALVTAYASGRLTRQAQVNIAFAIMDRNNSTGEVPTALFRALANHPQAAANFARYLLSDGRAMSLFLRAKGWGDWYPGFQQEGGQERFQNGLLGVLTAAVTVMSPAEVQSLAHGVSAHLPTVDLKDARAVEGQLAVFLKTAAARLLPRPVPAPGEPTQVTLQKWAAAYGANLESLLAPYEKWLTGIYADHKEAMQREHAFVENIVLGTLGAVITAPIGSPGLSLAANGLYGGAAGELQGFIDSHLHWSTGPDGPANDPRNYLRKSAIIAVVGAAYTHGLVGQKGEPVTLSQLEHDPRYAPGFLALLKSVESGSHPTAGDTDWAYQLHLKDGGDLGAILDALRSHYQ